MKDSTNMERFLNQQNIKRYQKLLSLVSDETHRRQILSMLKEEELVREDLSTRRATADRITVVSSRIACPAQTIDAIGGKRSRAAIRERAGS